VCVCACVRACVCVCVRRRTQTPEWHKSPSDPWGEGMRVKEVVEREEEEELVGKGFGGECRTSW
jgi:hypothetical protein